MPSKQTQNPLRMDQSHWKPVQPPKLPQLRNLAPTIPEYGGVEDSDSEEDEADRPSSLQPTGRTDRVENSQELDQKLENLFQSWSTSHSPETFDAIFKLLKPTVSRSLNWLGSPQDKLLQGRAKVLVLRGLETYQPTGKSSLRSHIFGHLRSLLRENQRIKNPITIPERIALDWKKMKEAELELLDEMGRPPSDQELADRLQISPARLAKVRKAKLAVPAGQFQQLGDDGLYANEPAVELNWRQRNTLTWSILLDDLSPINRKIAEWALGWNGQPQLSNQQIAKELGITPGAVSQRKAEIQARYNQLRMQLWG